MLNEVKSASGGENQNSSMNNELRSKNKLVWWLIGLIILGAVGYGGWYLGKLQNPNNNDQITAKGGIPQSNNIKQSGGTNPSNQNSNISAPGATPEGGQVSDSVGKNINVTPTPPAPTGDSEVPFEEINFYNSDDIFGCGRYMSWEDSNQQGSVIITEQEYIDLQRSVKDKNKCEWKSKAPEIDFTSKSLIGKYFSWNDCPGDADRTIKVIKNDSSKKITYINQPGVSKVTDSPNNEQITTCARLAFSMNWVTIPKIPEGYSVVFDFE